MKIVPHIDRDDLVHLTTHTVLHNLTEGILLVVIVLFFFLGNIRSALIVAVTIPFSLFFASILLDLRHIPANLLSLGALDFGMIVEGAAVMVENIQRRLEVRTDHGTIDEIIRSAAHEVQRPVFYAIAIIIIVVSAHLHPAARGRPAVPADGLDGGFRAAGLAVIFHPAGAGAGQLHLPQGSDRPGAIRWCAGSTVATRATLTWIMARRMVALAAMLADRVACRCIWRWAE